MIHARRDLLDVNRFLEAFRAEDKDLRRLRRLDYAAAQTIVNQNIPVGTVELSGRFALIGARQQVSTDIDQSLSNPGQLTQASAQRLLASEVNATDMPRPLCGSSISSAARAST